MSCKIKYQDQEFDTPEELLSYAKENNIQEIISAFEPTGNDYYQQESQSKLPPNEEINKKIEGFLEKIGVSIYSVGNIRDSTGKVISAVAKADMLNKIIEVAQDRADETTLPEEASHFFVEMLGDNNSLLKEMLDKITGYKIYPEVVTQYKNNKAYRNEDGSIDFLKIKKEAIAKIISEFVINQNPGSENDAKTTSFMNWWSKLWDHIKSLFSKEQSNPFKYIANQILEQNVDELDKQALKASGEYYQLGHSIDNLESDQDKIQLDNSIDPVSGQKRHIYTYNGEKAKGSVTSVYVDAWLKRIFRSDNRSENQKMIDLMKADYGDTIHEEMQNIVNSWTNSDGTLKETQSPHVILTSKTIYDKLNNYVQDLISQYPEGTIFKTETKIYDQKTKVAGSIDFLAIQPSGKVDIYDWKSQEIGKNQDDLKSYKTPMYRIQLENYRKILELQYGFNDFGKIRAIPIATKFQYNKSGISHIKDIEIGSIDPTEIPEEKNYLLPVTLKNESTNNEDLDKMIVKLNGIYDKISLQRYSKEELYKKREELAKLGNALRDLQLRGKVDKLIELGLLEFDKYNDQVKAGTLSGKDVIESQKILAVFNQSGTFLYDLLQDLHKSSKETGDPESIAAYEEMKNKFLSMTARTGKLISDIEKYRDIEANKLAAKDGIVSLLDPEAPIGAINGLFASLGKITQKSFRVFAKMLRSVQNTRDARFDEMTEKLTHLKSDFVNFSKAKGLSIEKAMDMMLNINDKGQWNGNFVSMFKPEFYKGKEKAIKEGDTKWMLENLDFDDIRYNEQEKKQIEFFKSIRYYLDDLKNEDEVNKKINEWKNYNNVLTDKGGVNVIALMNPANNFLRAKDQWYTDKWIELNKPENSPVKAAYDYFQSLTRHSEKLGMLDRFSPGFIPSIFSTKMDQLVFGNVKNIFSTSGFFENLEVDSGSKYTPEIDPTDGSVINRIPVYFTHDMGIRDDVGNVDYSKKSRDLFKVFAVWGGHTYNYEAMQNIEDSSMILLEAERNKSSLVTDRFGNVIMENGKVKAANNNDRNAKLLENFVNFYLYDKITGVGSDTKFKVPFVDKEYSLTKTVSSAIQFFGFKTLALNPISGTSQFVGGSGNAAFMAKKGIFFTNKTWAKGMYMAISDKKTKAAIHWANVWLEGNHNHSIAGLTLSPTNKVLSKDTYFAIQRAADMGVQNPVAASMMLNHMVENGKIVDITKFVKDKYDYNNTFYSLSKPERQELIKKIDNEVKELQDTRSIVNVGVLNDKGHFSLPGIDKDSQTMEEFRSKIKGVLKKILGNVGREDINQIRTTVLGMSLMQFRNWIPEMIEERLSGLKYDDALQTYTYGKMNLFFSEVFSKRFPVLLKSIVTGFGNDGIQGAKDKYNELKRSSFEKGQDFNISEGEFIDMYVGNIRSQMLELMVLTAFTGAILAISAGGKSPDDDDKGLKNYARRALAKYYNEFAFYYNPIEFTNLVKSPLPVVGLAEDFVRFNQAMGKYMIGEFTGNDTLRNKAHPAKYFFKMVPVAKEAMLIMAAHDDQFRKDWGIKLASNNYSN